MKLLAAPTFHPDPAFPMAEGGDDELQEKVEFEVEVEDDMEEELQEEDYLQENFDDELQEDEACLQNELEEEAADGMEEVPDDGDAPLPPPAEPPSDVEELPAHLAGIPPPPPVPPNRMLLVPPPAPQIESDDASILAHFVPMCFLDFRAGMGVNALNWYDDELS